MTVSAAGARDDCEERFSTFSRLLRLLRTPSESAFEKASALACGMDQCPIPTSDFNSYACLLLGPLWSVTSTGCGASEVPAKVAVPDWWSPASSRYAYVQVLVLLPAAFCRSLWSSCSGPFLSTGQPTTGGQLADCFAFLQSCL